MMRIVPIRARAARSLVLLLALAGIAPTGCAFGPFSRVEPETRSERVVRAALIETRRQAPGTRFVLSTSDPTGVLGDWLLALEDSLLHALRASGVPAYPAPLAPPGAVTLRLAAREHADRLSLAIVSADAERTRALAQLSIPVDAGERLARRGPLAIAGRGMRSGPELPWPIWGLMVESDGVLWAETTALAHRIALDGSSDRLRAEVRGSAPAAPFGPPSSRTPDRRAFVLSEGPRPLAGLALVGYVSTPRGFAAVDRFGTLRHGGAHGLAGAPVHGFGGGIVALDGLLVTATDARPGDVDALVVLTISTRGVLDELERIALGPEAITALAALDVDGDGRDDLVVARELRDGARLDAFVTGGNGLP